MVDGWDETITPLCVHHPPFTIHHPLLTPHSSMPNPSPWRILLSGRRSGHWNMAVDAAILKSVEEGKAPPTLRLYGWEPWCVTLGYNQDPARELDPAALRERGWDFALRPTGG